MVLGRLESCSIGHSNIHGFQGFCHRHCGSCAANARPDCCNQKEDAASSLPSIVGDVCGCGHLIDARSIIAHMALSVLSISSRIGISQSHRSWLTGQSLEAQRRLSILQDCSCGGPCRLHQPRFHTTCSSQIRQTKYGQTASPSGYMYTPITEGL